MAFKGPRSFEDDDAKYVLIKNNALKLYFDTSNCFTRIMATDNRSMVIYEVTGDLQTEENQTVLTSQFLKYLKEIRSNSKLYDHFKRNFFLDIVGVDEKTLEIIAQSPANKNLLIDLPERTRSP